jgi:hypothetical protein
MARGGDFAGVEDTLEVDIPFGVHVLPERDGIIQQRSTIVECAKYGRVSGDWFLHRS